MEDQVEFHKVRGADNIGEPPRKGKFLSVLHGPKIPLGRERRKGHVALSSEMVHFGNYIAREFDSRESALFEARKCDRLRADGIPTHPTSRYFEQNGRHYVLYTDETQGGKRQIWSVNNSIHELRSMGLHEGNLDTIVAPLVENLADRCAQKGWRILVDAYWLVQEGSTLDVMIGDLGTGVQQLHIRSQRDHTELYEKNKESVGVFLALMRLKLREE